MRCVPKYDCFWAVLTFTAGAIYSNALEVERNHRAVSHRISLIYFVLTDGPT